MSKQTKLESFFTLADNNSEIHPIPIIDDIISTVIKTKRAHTSCSKEKAKEWCASYPWLDILFEDEETVFKYNVCKKHNGTNVWANDGAKNIQKSALDSNILDGNTRAGGASPHAGGRDERSLSSPAQLKRWIPPSSVKRDGSTSDEQNDIVFRKVRGILNKLSPEKFDKLSLGLLNVGIESKNILKGIILLIFDKALDEPKYSSVYAKLCHQLCEDAPNFEPPDSTTPTFRRLLLNKCQDEFENRSKATNAFEKDARLTEEELEQYHIAKRKMLGNIKFIGELGKLEMLHEGILHRCIKQLLEKKKNLPLQEMAEDLECLCQIMTTVGRRLDSPKAKAWMDQYFSRVKWFANNSELPSRIRFMLTDVIELRDNKWAPRKNLLGHGPKTITQIRQEAADETGVYIPQQNRGGGRPAMNGSMGAHWKPSSGSGSFGDFFGVPPAGIMGTLGTGPGVIQMDGYVPNYKNNNTRNNQNNTGFNNYNNYQKRDGSGGSPRTQRHNFQQQQQQGGGAGRLSPNQGQQQNTSPQPYQQQKKQSQLPPRLARLQQQQLQQQQNQQQQPSPPSQPKFTPQQPIAANNPQTMIMMQDGQMPIPFPNTSVPPPPLPKEEISLRPNRSFTGALRPSVPTMLPKSAQSAPVTGPPMMTGGQSFLEPKSNNLNPLLAKQAAVTIKEVPKDKLNPVKKKSHQHQQPSKEELKKSMSSTVQDYLQGGMLEDTMNNLKDLNPPKRYMPELVTEVMTTTIDRNDTDRENAMKLIAALKNENLVTSVHFIDGFKSVLDSMSGMESDVPLIKTYVAVFAAYAVADNIITLQELADPMEQGTYYPLFLICLQQMLKLKGKDWLVNIFNESKMVLQNMLPEVDRSKERMMEILEERGLSFMFPLLRVQSELWKQIQLEPNATAVFKWIKDKVSTDLHQKPAFIHVLTTSILRYITNESSLSPDCDQTNNPDKILQEKERQLLEKMKGVLVMFLQDKTDLQMHSLYASQVFCHSHNFPKGMMLRLFMSLYDMEVIEEEVFLKWKEEVNDEHPGKGRALFQVNQWLTWLEQAEAETDEED